MTDEEMRREAAARLFRAAESTSGEPLLCAVLSEAAKMVDPSGPAIDVDGTGYMLDRRADRMARAILGLENEGQMREVRATADGRRAWT